MLEVRLVLLLFLLFLIISALPIIKIRYASDLFESIEKMSDMCYQNFKCSNGGNGSNGSNGSNDNIELPEKYKYIYNMANTLYNMDDLDNDGVDDSGDENKKKEKHRKFYKNLFIGSFVIIIIAFIVYGVIYARYRKNTFAVMYTVFIAIVVIVILALLIFYFQTKNTGIIELNMLLYKQYLNYSMPTFFLGMWKFLFIYIYLFIQYYDNDYISISLMVGLFIFTALFTVIFGMVLKKITEIYNDTNLKDYIALMKKINKLLKENTINTVSGIDNKLTNIARKIKDYTDDKDRYFREIAYDKTTLYNLINTYKLSDGTTMEITKDDILNYEKYNSKKQIDNIKYRIDTVTSYLYAYALFLLIIVYFYMRTVEDTNIYVIIICAYIAIVILYYMYVSLRF